MPCLVRLYLVFVILIQLFLFVFVSKEYNKAFCVSMMLLDSCSLLLSFLAIKHEACFLAGKMARPSFMFLLAFVVVNFQCFVDLLLGLKLETDKVFVQIDLINKGVCFVSLSLNAYLLGYSMFFKKQDIKGSVIFPRKIINWLSFLLLLLFVLFIREAGLANLLYGNGYSVLGVINEDTTNRSEYLFNIVLLAIIVMVSYNMGKTNRYYSVMQYIKGYPLLFIYIIIGYIFLKFCSGVRGPLIKTVLLILFSYIYVNHKSIQNKFVLLFLIIGAFVISVLSFSRAFTGSDIKMKDKIKLGVVAFSNSEIKTISPLTYELANSLYCNQLALKIMEERGENPRWGVFQLRYLLNIVLPGKWLAVLFPMNVEDLSSAHFLTVKTFGRFAESGTGTTLNADFYLDFGIIGVIICMMLWGIFMRAVDHLFLSPQKHNYGLLFFIVALGLSSSTIYISRGTVIPILRSYIYVFLLLYGLRLFFIKKPLATEMMKDVVKN